MENQNHLILKLSRLFPSSFSSSCHHLRAVSADVVADSSISIAKTKKIPHNDNDRSKPTKGLKCPRAPPPLSNIELKKKHPSARTTSCNNNSNNIHVSSSSNSGFFSSSDDEKVKKVDVETDAFFSLSSNSGDSFRRLKRGEETTAKMKTIKEQKELISSFSSAKTSLDYLTAPSSKRGGDDMKKNCPNNATKKCSNKSGGQENNWLLSAGDHHAYYYGNKKVSDVNNIARNRVRRAKIKKRSFIRLSSSGSMLIRESRAVEKRSTDPRNDFRASMVEMIVEKQMVSAIDLERLLLCFLSLNEVSYHEMIFEVFSDICETLFSN